MRYRIGTTLGGMTPNRTGGRPRDPALDAAILEATLCLLNESGIDAVTFERIADRAGTTRPALYRRYRSRDELVVAALASLSETTSPEPTGDHLEDLVAELAAFRDAITRTHSITLVGSMLLDSVDQAVKDAYRTRIVRPRRDRIRRILTAARADGLLTGKAADQRAAVTMCTGSWYANVLAGEAPPRDWPRRTATLVWRSLGG